MKIAVCIKQVPTREWQPRLNDDKTWVREQDVSYEMNEPDAYALEESLRLREKHGGEVVVCSAGNTGRDGYGTITSPGNSRKVITVGSLTTWGDADPANDKAKIDETLRFVLDLGCIDALIVGFEKQEEIIDYKKRLTAALEAKGKGKA